jgi:ribosomal protein L7/L12
MSAEFEIVLKHLTNAIQETAAAKVHAQKAEAELARFATSAPLPNGRDVVLLLEAMVTTRKIDAIKLYRTLTGYGLKESKDAVEAVMDRLQKAEA